jgi:hypothetical protein
MNNSHEIAVVAADMNNGLINNDDLAKALYLY